jgi:hypothetical protein
MKYTYPTASDRAWIRREEFESHARERTAAASDPTQHYFVTYQRGQDVCAKCKQPSGAHPVRDQPVAPSVAARARAKSR